MFFTACISRRCRFVLARCVIFAVAGLCALVPARAETDAVKPAVVEPQVPAQSPITQAPVVLDGKELFKVRGVLSFSADARAEAIEQRLQRLAKNVQFDPRSLTVGDNEYTTDINAGDIVVMSVTQFDAALAQTDRHALAVSDAAKMRDALIAMRSRYSVRSIVLGVVVVLVLSVVLFLLLKVFSKVFPRLYGRVESWRGTVIPSLRIQKFELLPAERITDVMVEALRLLRLALTLLVLYAWASLCLGAFPWSRPYAHVLVGYVTDPLRSAAHAALAYLPNLFSIAVIMFVAFYVIKFVRMIFTQVGKQTIAVSGFHPEWAEPTYKLVRVLLIALTLVVVFPYLPGSKSPAFQGISIFLGVLLSLGSSSAISNVVAGVILTYMRAFKCGDRVQIADTVGDVIESTLLVTRIRTIKNVEITIANAQVLSAHIVNYSASANAGGLILHTEVTIGYDAPWRKIHELLMEAALATENVLQEPKPFILQTALDDFYVHYELNAYTDQPAKMAMTYSALHANIHDTFNAAGVEIMSPHFAAVRDGNRITLPDDALPKGYEAPGFRVGMQDVKRTAAPGADS
jgi:small-conductance mechanosensitive channel